MKNNKHTPGPWKIFKGTRNDVLLTRVERKDRFHGIVNEANLPLAEIILGSTDANATLIAAAPEMLEALEMIEERLGHRQGDCYSDDYMGLCVCGKDKIKAVISKAKGVL